MTLSPRPTRSTKIFQVRTSRETGLNNTGRRLTCAAARHSLFECDDYVLRLVDFDESAMASRLLGSDALMYCKRTCVIRFTAVVGLGMLHTLAHRLVDSDSQIDYRWDAIYDPL